MRSATLTPIQSHLLKIFAWDSDENSLLEVKKVLTRHFAKKLDDELDELWDNGQLNQSRLDEIYNIENVSSSLR
jgi:hypothetical protein